MAAPHKNGNGHSNGHHNGNAVKTSATITGTTLPDIQKTPDQRGIAIDEVGVSNIRFPLTFPLRDGGVFNTVAKVSMRVSLPATEKGTHMSRFMIALQEKNRELKPGSVGDILNHLLELLHAEVAFLDMSFPIFLKRPAPVSGLEGIMDYECSFKGVRTTAGEYEKLLEVRVNAASLCPCSKEISDFGAHNQRSLITIRVREGKGSNIMWFEDLIEIAEQSASCQLYPILKRPDEKFVTERAYQNPKFVEDIVRDVAGRLQTLLDENRVDYYFVSSNNYESIHNHDAYAQIQRGTMGQLLSNFAHS
ncbi:MAG: GTP cyclohydrolase FolE2 [Candidatus Sumerlaeia bacterium]|nr:GTP cyclohydrolase FolE2 [Candidatus Sumerlaeia bacterium]